MTLNFNNLYEFQNQEHISEFFPIKTKDDIDENLICGYESNNSFSSIDRFESVFNNIFENRGNHTGNSSKNKIPEIILNVDKIKDVQLEKLCSVKKLIFLIKKKEKKNKSFLPKQKIKLFITKKNKKNLINIIKLENNFPFSKPKGIISYYKYKFNVKKFGKKIIVSKSRKDKMDDILKKIKSRFHKDLKNILNKYLKLSGAKKLFGFLPQSFISNISKSFNFKCLNLTYKELLSTNFEKDSKKNILFSNGYKKYLKNKDVLNYLEENPEISKLSGFDVVQNIKYKDLFKRYLNSAEFENSIVRLKNEKEKPEYINKYIIYANKYIEHFNGFKN